MSTPSIRPAAENPRTWSATYVPPGTPIRHTIDTDDREIRLIFGTGNAVELVMDPLVAEDIAAGLQRAIGAFNDAHNHPATDPDAA